MHGVAIAVIDDVGNRHVADAVWQVVAVRDILVTDQNAAVAHALGRGVRHTVNDHVIDMRVDRKQTNKEAVIGVRAHVADNDIVDVALATAPILAHHVRGAKRAALAATAPRDGGQSDHVVTRVTGNIRNSDMMAAVTQVKTVLVFHILQHAVHHLAHTRVKLDLLYAPLGARLQRDRPTVAFLDFKPADG